jgi:uncharacterized protein YdaU (DUF1376 family)
MHYYKRNLGDYAKKAGRLSMLQHGAYTLLIDTCYDREQFPTEEEAIEWTWASTEAEIEAVKFVLKRFFTFENGVYIQNRIQEEIDLYHDKSEKNKQIAIEREELKRERARNVDNQARIVQERAPNQEPITINHKPITNNQDLNIKDLKDLSGKPDGIEENLNAEQIDSLDDSNVEIVKQVTEYGFLDAKPDTKREKSAKHEYPMEFESAWQLYPKRLGDNPKQKALKAWVRSLREGSTVEQMTDGIARYAKFCVATGKVGTEAVKHAATFLGSEKAFLEDWALPGSEVRKLNGSFVHTQFLTAEEKRRQGTARAKEEFLASFKTIEGEVVR